MEYQIIDKQLAEEMIDSYPGQYQTPKYLLFILEMNNLGFRVGLKEAKTTFSKYVLIEKGTQKYKIRFSNHRSKLSRELEQDCDFYVGVGNLGVITTEQVIEQIKESENTPKSDLGFLLSKALSGVSN